MPLVASAVFGATVGRLGAARLRTIGLLASAAAATVLAGYALARHPDQPVVAMTWVLLGVVVAGMGCCIPGTTAIAQQAGRRVADAVMPREIAEVE